MNNILIQKSKFKTGPLINYIFISKILRKIVIWVLLKFFNILPLISYSKNSNSH